MASSSVGDSSSSTSAATPVSLDETDEATAAAIRDDDCSIRRNFYLVLEIGDALLNVNNSTHFTRDRIATKFH